MMASISSKILPSKYKYVAKELKDGKVKWCLTMPNYSRKRYDTELEAAKAIDMILIRQGKEPVNVLKRA